MWNDDGLMLEPVSGPRPHEHGPPPRAKWGELAVSSPTELNYGTPQPPSDPHESLMRWASSLPRPSKATVVALLLTAVAAYILNADHAAWVVVRQFDGALPRHSSPNGAFSSDGKRLLAIGRTIRVYDVATGNTLCDLHPPGVDTSSATFSPDGSRIWSVTDGTAMLWDLPSGRALRSLAPFDREFAFDWLGQASASPFSPNGQWVVATDEVAMVVCDGHSGVVLTKLPCAYFPVFSPDSRYLAALSALPPRVRIWDTHNWQEVATIGLSNRDGLSGDDGFRIAFSPDSKKLAIAFGARVDLWDAATKQVSPALTLVRQVWGCSFAPDGRHLLTHEDNNVCENWDMATRKCVGVSTSSYVLPVISSDGRDVVGSGEIRRFPSFTPLQDVSVGNQMAWLPGQRAFVVANMASPIRLSRLRRPEAAYGLIWLPQFWWIFAGTLASAWLIRRDLAYWHKRRAEGRST
jgi:WD40 repeat protein